MVKCKLCKKKDRMVSTEFCLDCFVSISQEIHEVSMEMLRDKELS